MLGQASSQRAAVLGQQKKIQQRADQRENSLRAATNSFSFTCTGASTYVAPAPVMFDCTFLQEPHVTSGMVLVRSADLNLYELPTGQVVVYRWIKEPVNPKTDKTSGTSVVETVVASGGYRPNIIGEPDDDEPMYYTGCYLYFVVKCPQLPTLTLPQIAMANANPPNPVVHQHISFAGQGMKTLPDSVTAMADDAVIAAQPTPFGLTVTADQ